MDPNPPRETPATTPDIRQTPDGKYQFHDTDGTPRGPLHDDRDAAVKFADQVKADRERDTPRSAPKDGGVGGSRDR